MKAIVKCPKCGKNLTSDCRGCIESESDVHKCKGMEQVDIINGIKWKILEEDELNGELTHNH